MTVDLPHLVDRFLAGSLPREEWTHEAHLTVGLWHVSRYGTEEALARLRAGILRLNDRHGTPNTPTGGYHETITRAYVELLAEFVAGCPDDMALTDRVAHLLNGPLAERDVLFRFFSRGRLHSPEARARWVEPDLAPIRMAWSRQPGPLRFTLTRAGTDGDEAMSATKVVSPREVAAALTEYWSPRVVAELDDSYVKVAKILGTLTWHSHDDEDELFFVLQGHLRIELDSGAVELSEGDVFVVPKGVRHNPVAEQECHVMLVERKSTRHTGNEVTDRTRSIAEQLRPT